MPRQINWTPPTGPSSVSSQKVRKRLVGSSTWDETGFTPTNPMGPLVSSATVTLLPNRKYELEQLALCGTQESTNSAGIKEGIEFACITANVAVTTDSSTVSINAANTDISSVRFTLRRSSDDTIIYGPITVPVSNNVATTTAPGLVTNTQYYWQADLSASVNGTPIFSSSPTQLNALCGPFVTRTDCQCAEGYTATMDYTCVREETIGANIENSNYCLATSQNPVYSNEGSRIYSHPFDRTALAVDFGVTDSRIAANLVTPIQWKNTAATITGGPMNRSGVWIDTDCNGQKDSLTQGAQTIIPYTYNNTGPARIFYIGIGSDNLCKMTINDALIFDYSDEVQFITWNIIPVVFRSGINYVNIISTGDGTANDSIAVMVYDNTLAEISSATSDSQLNILFTTEDLRGLPYTIASCNPGYSLDLTNGDYTCKRTLIIDCGETPSTGGAGLYGITTNGQLPTIQQILAGTEADTTGTRIVGDFRSLTGENWLFIAEPVTQPLRTKWYQNDFSTDFIGDTENGQFRTWYLQGEVAGNNGVTYRVYATAFQAVFTDALLELRTS